MSALTKRKCFPYQATNSTNKAQNKRTQTAYVLGRPPSPPRRHRRNNNNNRNTYVHTHTHETRIPFVGNVFITKIIHTHDKWTNERTTFSEHFRLIGSVHIKQTTAYAPPPAAPLRGKNHQQSIQQVVYPPTKPTAQRFQFTLFFILTYSPGALSRSLARYCIFVFSVEVALKEFVLLFSYQWSNTFLSFQLSQQTLWEDA